jgi:ankyrin repeat protein
MASVMEIPQSDALAQSVTAAIQGGDIGKLQSLLAGNPGLATARIIDARNGSLRTLLLVATDWPGHFPNVARTIAVLAEAGADPNAPCIGGNAEETPLHWAASSNDVEALDALLDHGAHIENPGAIFTGGTAMSDAVIFACWDAARRLLERGAKTNLTQAAGLGLLDRLQPYFEQEAAPSEQEVRGALWHACRGGQLEAAQFLIAKGADRNWIGWDNIAPLDGARQSGNAELSSWLEEHGAKSAKELNS